jgi:hypothetical protein
MNRSTLRRSPSRRRIMVLHSNITSSTFTSWSPHFVNAMAHLDQLGQRSTGDSESLERTPAFSLDRNYAANFRPITLSARPGFRSPATDMHRKRTLRPIVHNCRLHSHIVIRAAICRYRNLEDSIFESSALLELQSFDRVVLTASRQTNC